MQTLRSTRSRFSLFGISAVCLALNLWSSWAAAPSSPQGFITQRVFNNLSGTSVASLTNATVFPNSPDAVLYDTYFEAWATGDINTPPGSNIANNYGEQMVGYFYPATSGDFTFYLCSDDNSSLYLSTDDNPANKKLIAAETAWSNVREYTTSGGNSTLTAKDSSQYAGTEWPTKDTVNGGAKITLQAGKAYYIEALHKEGGGGDNLSVSIDGTLPIPGNMLSTFDKTSGPASITTQPVGGTFNENASASFSVAANGTPPFSYQWNLNGTPIQGATNQTFSLSRIPASYNNQALTVTVTGGQGAAITSNPAQLVINADKSAPTLVSAHAGGTNTVTVTYSEPIDPTTGTNAANYTINGLTVSSVAIRPVPNDNVVDVTTANQTAGQTYTLSVSNVKDIAAAGNTLAASSKLTFPADQLLPGVMHKYFSGSTSGTPEDVLTDPRYPNSPSYATSEPEIEYPPFSAPWEFPASGNNEAGDNYGNILSGWIVAPVTGNYVFFVCSDDHSSLYLSTDDNPANKQLIAAESAWSNQRQWITSGGSSDLAQKRSDQNPNATGWPKNTDGGVTINLTAGKKYYFEALHQEGGGGDNVDVTWQIPGARAVADNDPPISALDVVAYVDPSKAPAIAVTTPPASLTIPEGRKTTLSAAFSVPANSPTVYSRWQAAPSGSSTFTNIMASTGKAKLTTPTLQVSDSGIKYQLVIASVGTNIIAGPATVTVVPDTFPPVATVGAINHDGAVQVGVSFDKPVSAASAGVAANYSIPGGSVTAATVVTNNPADVILTTTGLTVGQSYTLTIKNISDTLAKPNTLASTNVTFKVPATQWASIGSPTIPASVVPVGDNGYDVISGGKQFWSTYDEVTFVYVPKTNDFDVAVQVIEQDPASEWARGGMQVRESTDEGKTEAESDPTLANPYLFSAYRDIHANPNSTVGDQNQVANNSFEANQRVGIKYGAADNTTSGWSVGAGAIPNYPDVWLRLVRKVNHISGFYSNDGAATWVDFAESDWPNAPAVLLVGPGYGPENANAWTDAANYRSYMTQYRNFGDFTGGGGGTGTNTFTSITMSGGSINIAWTGTAVLQSATDVTGPWTPVANATSPLKVQATGTRQFYRLH